MKTKQEYQEMLRESVCHVQFTKKDGTIRDMNCTLLVEALPVEEINEGAEKKPIPYNPDVIRVWDIDKAAWRSIIIASIIEFDKRAFSGEIV